MIRPHCEEAAGGEKRYHQLLSPQELAGARRPGPPLCPEKTTATSEGPRAALLRGPCSHGCPRHSPRPTLADAPFPPHPHPPLFSPSSATQLRVPTPHPPDTGARPHSPLTANASNRKSNLLHKRPPPTIQKASRRTKCATHWLPIPPPLCKPPPHSSSLRVVSPPPLLFWTELLVLPSRIGCYTCRSWLGGLLLAVGSFLGRLPGLVAVLDSRLSNGRGVFYADWLSGGIERFQRPWLRGPDGAVAGSGVRCRFEALPADVTLWLHGARG